MDSDFDRQLRRYAALAVRVGLNLQPGQRLLIIGPLANGGVSLEAAPLVRHIAAAAYQAGAELVEPIWGDEAVLAARFEAGPERLIRPVLGLASDALSARRSRARGAVDLRERSRSAEGDAGRPGRQGSTGDRARRTSVPGTHFPQPDELGRRRCCRPGVGCARVSRPPADRADVAPVGSDRQFCRLDRDDPIVAWESHLADLAARTEALNRKAYTALRYTGPGTDLTIGLPGRTHLGRRPVRECRRHHVLPEPANRGGVHDAAQGSRGGRRSIDQAAQLRRHVDRGFQRSFAAGSVVEVKARRGRRRSCRR